MTQMLKEMAQMLLLMGRQCFGEISPKADTDVKRDDTDKIAK